MTEDEIVIALREIADEIDREKFKGVGILNLMVYILEGKI